MNNQEYEKHIESKLEVLDELIKLSYQTGKDVIGETLFKEDLFFVAILNRFATLTSGFQTLIKERNLTCCGALLRLQLDNCMRLYGLNIAEDMSNAIDTVMSGGRFDKLKDKNGKQMKDGYLKEQISNFDSRFEDLYNSTSGYIHFADKGFFQSVRPKENNCISMQISKEISEEFNPLLIECLDAYIHYSKFFLNMFSSVIENKCTYDEQHKED